jgi:hypothetical protein
MLNSFKGSWGAQPAQNSGSEPQVTNLDELPVTQQDKLLMPTSNQSYDSVQSNTNASAKRSWFGFGNLRQKVQKLM